MPCPSTTYFHDLRRCRDDFPLLQREVNGNPVIYLDSAATTLKPQAVIDAVLRFYTEYTANVHRAVHLLSEEATEAFEGARERLARFIGAESREIVFLRHATEALNLVAASLPVGSLVAVGDGEHHSNLLPWRGKALLRLPIDAAGGIELNEAAELMRARRPALLTMSTIGNALGTRQRVAELSTLAREVGALVLLDVSQSIGHEPVDVSKLDCDFLCFSGHKMLGPGGVGILYARSGKEAFLQPLLQGGSMVMNVGIESCELQPFPWCLEAGTPPIEAVLGLAAACDYLDSIGLEEIHAHNAVLSERLRSGLTGIARVEQHGGEGAEGAADIVNFSIAGLEAHGVARLLSNRYGIMVRSGYHCAQPLHELCGLPETVRASVHLYNSVEEIDVLVEALGTVARIP